MLCVCVSLKWEVWGSWDRPWALAPRRVSGGALPKPGAVPKVARVTVLPSPPSPCPRGCLACWQGASWTPGCCCAGASLWLLGPALPRLARRHRARPPARSFRTVSCFPVAVLWIAAHSCLVRRAGLRVRALPAGKVGGLAGASGEQQPSGGLFGGSTRWGICQPILAAAHEAAI